MVRKMCFTTYRGATIDYIQERGAVEAFFQSQTDDSSRLNILQAYGIAYLFYGPQERALDSFNPEDKAYLMKSFSNSEVSIYQVLEVENPFAP